MPRRAENVAEALAGGFGFAADNLLPMMLRQAAQRREADNDQFARSLKIQGLEQNARKLRSTEAFRGEQLEDADRRLDIAEESNRLSQVRIGKSGQPNTIEAIIARELGEDFTLEDLQSPRIQELINLKQGTFKQGTPTRPPDIVGSVMKQVASAKGRDIRAQSYFFPQKTYDDEGNLLSKTSFESTLDKDIENIIGTSLDFTATLEGQGHPIRLDSIRANLERQFPGRVPTRFDITKTSNASTPAPRVGTASVEAEPVLRQQAEGWVKRNFFEGTKGAAKWNKLTPEQKNKLVELMMQQPEFQQAQQQGPELN